VRRFLPFLLVLLCGFFPWQPSSPIACCLTPPYSTWDTTVNPTVNTYTNGNLTVTCTGCGSGAAIGRGTNNHSIGKWHVELTATTVGLAGYQVGLANIAQPLNVVLGGDNRDGIAYIANSGIVQYNNTTELTLNTYTSGAIICEEVDLTNLLFWVKLSTDTYWNGSSSANPATGAGGINIATISSGILYPAEYSTATFTDATTLNVGASSFACTPSSGFNAWG